MKRARRVCRLCSQLAEPGKTLCSKHLRELARDDRPSSRARGYDDKWRRIRAAFLEANPFCQDCGMWATEVDHLVPLREGGTHAWSNLVARCKSHHSQKTASQDGGFGNPVRR